MSKKERICPKCGAKCNYKDNTEETIYVWCTNKKCNYQTWKPKYPMRNGLIHEIRKIYKN